MKRKDLPDDDPVLEIEELDPVEAAKLALLVPIEDDGGEDIPVVIGETVERFGDAIDRMFDSNLLSDEPPLDQDVTAPDGDSPEQAEDEDALERAFYARFGDDSD